MAKFAEKERIERWKKSDFYTVLGLAPSATTVEVKKGFRKVALTCHPDKVAPEERERATKHFQLIAEAYEVLSKDDSRKRYDAVRPRGGRPAADRVPYPVKQAGGGGAGYGTQAQDPAVAARKKAEADAYKDRVFARWSEPAKDPFDGSWHRCDGCDMRVLLKDLKKCKICPFPHSAGLVCDSCGMCAGCVAPDSGNGQFPPRHKPAQAPPRGNVPRVEARTPQQQQPDQKPGWQARPLHEELGEVWHRVDTVDQAAKPVPVRASASSAKAKDADEAIHRHARAPTPDPPEEELDPLGVLMAMGFSRRRATAALMRHSSVEAAVEYCMLQGDSGVYSEYIAPVVGPAAQGLYNVADHVGVAAPANQAASALYDVAAQASAGLYGAVIQPVAEKLYGESGCNSEAKSDSPADMVGTLVAFGFTEAQARQASSRCSSVEAAVEWISTHPEVQ